MQARLGPFERLVNGLAEISGANDFGRGMDRLARGDLGGGLTLAMASLFFQENECC